MRKVDKIILSLGLETWMNNIYDMEDCIYSNQVQKKEKIMILRNPIKKLTLALILSTSIHTIQGMEAVFPSSQGHAHSSQRSAYDSHETPRSPEFKDRVNVYRVPGNTTFSPNSHWSCYEDHLQDVKKLKEKIDHLGKVKKAVLGYREQIEELQNKLDVQSKALEELGGDPIQALNRLDEKESTLSETLQAYQSVGADLQGSFRDSIADCYRMLNQYEIYRDVLSESPVNLTKKLNLTRSLYTIALKDYGDFEQLDKTLAQAVANLDYAYAKHTVGPNDSNLLSKGVLDYFLRTLGVSEDIFPLFDRDNLYQLLAGSLELPYYVHEEWADNQAEWKYHAKELLNVLKLRLQEDVDAVQVGGTKFGFQRHIRGIYNPFAGYDPYADLTPQPAQPPKIKCFYPEVVRSAVNRQFRKDPNPINMMEKILSSRDVPYAKGSDLVVFNNIFTMHQLGNGSLGGHFKIGEVDANIPEWFKKIISTSHGLLGFCLAALSREPVRTWVDPSVLNCHAHIKKLESKNHQRSLATYVLERTESVMRLHVNYMLLSYLIDTM